MGSTAADAAWNGTNDFIASAIDSEVGHHLGGTLVHYKNKRSTVRPIKVDSNAPKGHEGAGAGRFMELSVPRSRAELVEDVKIGLRLGHRELFKIAQKYQG